MVELITEYFSGLNGPLAVFIVSMMPIVELRGAVPFGISLGLDWRLVYIISVIGNTLPVPFIILFIRPIIEFLGKTKMFSKLAAYLEQRTLNKKSQITKYKMLGLYILVTIPLPGTGAWTGAMLAGLLDMRIKDALPMIFLGVISAGILMMGITYGFGELFSHFV